MTELTDIFVSLVERYATAWHNGVVPDGEGRVQFIARVLDAYCPDSERILSNVFSVEEWLEHKKFVGEQLAQAADCLGRAQAARWTN